MITGTVNANREPMVQLGVRGPQGEREEIEALIDTGFNGFLTLPQAIVAAMNLPHLGRGRAILADGSEAIFDIYEATVMWEGNSRAVEAAGPVALLGMAMLDGHDLWIQAVDGGRVTIEASR